MFSKSPSGGTVEIDAVASSLRGFSPYGNGQRTMSGSGLNTERDLIHIR